MPKCVTLFHIPDGEESEDFEGRLHLTTTSFKEKRKKKRSSVSTGWAAFGLLPRPLCFFMDSIVETSSSWMAENGLVFRNGYLTLSGIDTYSIFFRHACLFSSARTVVWLSSLVFAILFFSTMRPLVLLSRRGFLKFSNDLNFNSKFGRHSFSVNLFIPKVIFFVTWVAFCFQDSNNFCSRPTSAILSEKLSETRS